MNDYLFSLKFTVSKSELKMSCCIDFHYSLYYQDDFHSLWHVKRLKWWGFLVSCTFFSSSFMPSRLQKAIYYQLIISKIYINKSARRKPTIWSTVLAKPKTNFIPTVENILFISNKTCYSYFKLQSYRGKRLL